MSAPSLQECTNSHAYGIAQSFGVGPQMRNEWPESAEDYAVFAIRLQYEASLRNSFRPILLSGTERSERRNTYTGQLLEFLSLNKATYEAINNNNKNQS